MSISSICGALYGEKVRDSSPSLDLTRGSNHEVNLASRNNHRTLCTVLTKRMAEDLTEFLNEKGVRVRYLHSDIDTLERKDHKRFKTWHF